LGTIGAVGVGVGVGPVARSQTMPNLSSSPGRSSIFAGGHRFSESMDSSGPANVKMKGKSSPTRSSTVSFLTDHDSAISIGPEDHLLPPKSSGPMSLATARVMAQHRAELALNSPQFHIIVWDEGGSFMERFEVGTFMGKIESKIYYDMRPDVEGSDIAIVGVKGEKGLLDGRGEELTSSNGREGEQGCAGMCWAERGGKDKRRKSVSYSGKGKDRWWHTERGRWSELPLERFFGL